MVAGLVFTTSIILFNCVKVIYTQVLRLGKALKLAIQ